ncbi:MAG: hypothetical protein ACTSQI_06185 [Candidatus Helarchaeota archaeon]
MNKTEIDRKITIESKATIFFFLFILLEGYLIISSAIGLYPFKIVEAPPDYYVVVESPPVLYALYWLGIFCMILGFLIGDYNKIYPPITLIGGIILFLMYII